MSIARALLAASFVPMLLGASHARSDAEAPTSTLVAGARGTVFVDRNANGRMDDGERGIAGVAVSDQMHVVITDTDGRYQLPDATGLSTGVVFVSVPDGYRATRSFFQAVTASSTASIDFALSARPRASSVTFVHASDTHISAASRARTERLRALVDSIRPDFVIITGDLVRDALRVGEAEATGYYTLFDEQARLFSRPLFTVPGNHEIFGIERDKSGVSSTHPLYGRAMYRKWRGPDYYSFNLGGVHFVALNTVDFDDQHYYGHVDSVQVAWLARDLATVSPTTPVVTFNHIPFFSSLESVNGYSEAPPAPTVITVRGKSLFRHTVSNAREILALLRARPYPLALGGHVHVREQLRFAGIDTRFEQAAAVVAPTPSNGMHFPSGVSVYRISKQRISESVFVPFGIDSTAQRR